MKRAMGILMALALMLTAAGGAAEGAITVQGTGIVVVDADMATVSLGVREIARDVVTAQTAVNGKMDAIIRTLKEQGVSLEDLSTNSIGIYPNYSYGDYDEEKLTSYTAYNNLQVTVRDLDSVGTLIDAAFAAGANSLDYVEFQASDTSAAAERALALAVDSAKQKAAVLAEAAGVKLGAISEIREEAGYGWDSGMQYARAVEADTVSSTQVLASQQRVTSSISMTFALEP